MRGPLGSRAITDQALSAIRAQLDEAAFADAWEQGRTLTADEAVALALEFVSNPKRAVPRKNV